ncbi:MAG: hypothetical protein ACXACA_08735, partial [Candidatus Ranarchaeia archaeon]
MAAYIQAELCKGFIEGTGSFENGIPVKVVDAYLKTASDLGNDRIRKRIDALHKVITYAKNNKRKAITFEDIKDNFYIGDRALVMDCNVYVELRSSTKEQFVNDMLHRNNSATSWSPFMLMTSHFSTKNEDVIGNYLMNNDLHRKVHGVPVYKKMANMSINPKLLGKLSPSKSSGVETFEDNIFYAVAGKMVSDVNNLGDYFKKVYDINNCKKNS